MDCQSKGNTERRREIVSDLFRLVFRSFGTTCLSSLPASRRNLLMTLVNRYVMLVVIAAALILISSLYF